MAKGDFAKAGFMNLPPWAKGAVVVGGLALTGFIIYKVVKKAKDTLSGKAKGDRQEDRGWNKEFDKLNGEPATKATITQAQMLSFANSIHTAMDGYQTDEDAIVAVFKNLKNDTDFAGVSAAYGTRVVSSGKWNVAPDFNGTLAGALTDELSQHWKDLINKDLAAKKITYKV